MKKVINLKKNHKTIAYLQKPRYKLPTISSAEQCWSVGRIFFNNIDSFELCYQTRKYLMPLDSIVYKK
jgi:hypothetical protein